MFLIWGFSSGVKELNLMQTMICKACGQFGKLNFFMTYRVFTLFFIPLIKFNKKFYVQMRCCGAVYEVDRKAAQAILHGSQTEFTVSDLSQLVQHGQRPVKYCNACGAKLDAEDSYCPKCGGKQP